MSEETPWAKFTDAELIKDSGGGHPGFTIETMFRLRNAIERQSRASGRLTWAIIALMVVQILVAIVKVGR